MERLRAGLDEYVAAMEGRSVKTQNEEVDFLISSTKDSLSRQFVAQYLYDHYLDSRIMGAEGVAVHINDEWLESGKLTLADPSTMAFAAHHAALNRRTLLGRKAPELKLRDASGVTVSVPSHSLSQRPSVLFFYSTSCQKCKMESILLRSIVEDRDKEIDFYAICLDGDRNGWQDYVKEYLDFKPSGQSTVSQLWDPDESSGMKDIYGIISTPQIFLTDSEGTIIGHKLSSSALFTMLDNYYHAPTLEYGSHESMTLLEGLFSEAGTTEEINAITDYMLAKSREEAGREGFRQAAGDLLYFFTRERSSRSMKACEHLVENHIEKSGDWRNPNDSLMVLGLAKMQKDLYSKAPVGKKIPDIRIRGKLTKPNGKTREGWFHTSRATRGEKALVIFHSSHCRDCKAELAAAERLAAVSTDLSILTVEIEANEDAREKLQELFDLSRTPQILLLDSRAKVLERYLSLLQP